MTRALGFDPSSTRGTAWAALDIAGPFERPRFVALGEIEATKEAMQALLRAQCADLVAIESPEGGVWARARGAALLDLKGVATHLVDWAAEIFLPVVEAPAQRIRRALLPPKAKANDKSIRWLVENFVDGWPKPRKTDTHERDSAMAAIYGARLHLCDRRDARGRKAAGR